MIWKIFLIIYCLHGVISTATAYSLLSIAHEDGETKILPKRSVSTIELNYNGTNPCGNFSYLTKNFSTFCNSSIFSYPLSPFSCSNGEGYWNDGVRTFMDPIPAGNILTGVFTNLYGQFMCNETGEEPTILVSINDMLIAWEKMPTNTLCNCSSCMSNYSFSSNQELTNGYYYGDSNSFQIQVITNDICVSFANITLSFSPVEIQLSTIHPSSGPTSGGTLITVSGAGFNQTSNNVWICKFEYNDTNQTTIKVNASSADDGLIVTCLSPQVIYPISANISLSNNGGITWSENVLLFQYYESFTPISPGEKILAWLSKNWWIVLLCCIVVLVFVSIFILSFRGRNRHHSFKRTDDSLTPLLYDSISSYGSIKQDIPFEEIKIGVRIGKGNFGEVFLGTWRGISVAVKKCKLPSKQQSKQEIEEFLLDFEKEAAIMRSLRHPNILQFLGISYSNGVQTSALDGAEICIITEFMKQGNLYNILHDKSISISQDLLLRMALDICKGMNYLHHCDPIIIHRDLKTHNLLVDENFKVKVSDFGLAKLLVPQDSRDAMTSCGTPAYTAPEVLRNETYTEKVDVYSFGICLWEMTSRDEVYESVPAFQIIFAVGSQGLRPRISSECPSGFLSLMQNCWQEDAKLRPSFDDIMKILLDMENE